MTIAVRALGGALVGLVLAACRAAPPASVSPSPERSVAPRAENPPASKTPSSNGRKLGIRVRVDFAKGLGKQVDVALRIERAPQPGAAMAPFELTMSAVVDGEPGWPDKITELKVRDDVGTIPIQRSTGKDEEGDERVVWRAERATRGAIQVEYVVPLNLGAGQPTTGTRSWHYGFEAVGATLLPLPQGEEEWEVTFDLGEDDRLRASLEEGPGAVHATRSELDKMVFFQGDGRLTVDRGVQHLRAEWADGLAFEVPDAMGWIARADRGQRKFFRDGDPTPYTVYFVPTTELPGTWIGSGQTRSFLLHAGLDLPWSRVLRFVLAHEMVHRWVGMPGTGVRLDGPEGSAYWFTEGFTVHLTRALLLYEELATAQEAVDDLNHRTRRYFANPAQRANNDAIAKQFWTSLDHQNLPYDRGMLYAAELDAAIRARSKGQRTVGSLVLGLLERERDQAHETQGTASRPRNRGLPAGVFREAVLSELGEEGARRFDAVIMRGERPDPPSDAFGPCIRRKATPISQYDLGFAIGSFAKKTITNLRPDSAAARAGLTEGQKFIRSKGEIGKPDIPMQITIERDGKEVVVTFSPKGPTVDGFLWERVPGVEETLCGRTP